MWNPLRKLFARPAAEPEAPAAGADAASSAPHAASTRIPHLAPNAARGADASLARALGQHADALGTQAPAPRPERLLLALDEAGEYLLVLGHKLVLGHEQAAEADLPFLADVAARHARLELVDSLRAGARWRITPWSGERVLINGQPLAPEGRLLADRDSIELATNLVVRFVWPDPASASVRLDLAHGAECLGATRLLLCAAGEGGRVRAATRGRVHLELSSRAPELAFVWREREALLDVVCESGLRDAAGETRAHTRLNLPLIGRISLWRAPDPAPAPDQGQAAAQRPLSAPHAKQSGAPWGLSLEPARGRQGRG